MPRGRAVAGLLAVSIAAVGGCGGASTRVAAGEPLVEERTLVRRAAAPSEVGGAGGAIAAAAGSDAARALLYELLDAVIHEDADALRRVIAEEPWSVHALRLDHAAPRVLAPLRREVALQRILASRRASHLPEDARAGQLVAPEGVVITPVRDVFVDGAPDGLDPSDLVVRFGVDEEGARALLAFALHGRGVVVVRLAPDGARIVGL